MHDKFDLLVIGAGSGGVRAARMAARAGAKVAVAELASLGGTCVNLGCVPKKLYGYAAGFAALFEHASGYGWQAGRPTLDWERLKTNRRVEITRLNGIYEDLLRSAGVVLFREKASIAGVGCVRVGERTVAARHILVATGGQASIPTFPGHEFAFSSDHMFDLPSIPGRLVVVGGGYVACEFASIFRGFGSDVTLVVRGDRVLRGFDADVRTFFTHEIEKKGVVIRHGTEVAAIETVGAARRVMLTDGSSVIAETVLVATGRRPRSSGIGLEDIGVAMDARGGILVDDGYQTSVPGIYAVGDVIDRIALTPVAIAEAMVLIGRLFGNGSEPLDYADIPTAVFTNPNVAAVGLTEEEARRRHRNVVVYRSDFRPLMHALSGSSERTFVKVIEDRESGRVLGLHMVGPDAGEIVQGFAVAIKAGATKRQFDATIGIHPTLAEELVTLR